MLDCPARFGSIVTRRASKGPRWRVGLRWCKSKDSRWRVGFMDTAAVMQHLDLVITSDTAIAHLAGALGIRVWLALAKAADWRWLSDREESPWYPTMRLFRQREWGCWKEVFQGISAEIVAQCM